MISNRVVGLPQSPWRHARLAMGSFYAWTLQLYLITRGLIHLLLYEKHIFRFGFACTPNNMWEIPHRSVCSISSASTLLCLAQRRHHQRCLDFLEIFGLG